MQPKSRAPISPSALTSLSNSPPPSGFKFWPSGSAIVSDESCAPQNQHNWDRERLRYAQTHGLDPNCLRHVSNSDGSSIRYCGDSLKVFKSNESGSDEFDSGRSQAQVGTLKLELPVDEDDYLMPSPQQVQPTTAYVDFGDCNRNPDSISVNANLHKVYPDFCKTNIDNPEYLMNNDPPSPCQTIGIPTVSGLVQANGKSESSRHTQPYLPQRSSEEESDHEYYNDFDRLQRELQPLHKGETTV